MRSLFENDTKIIFDLPPSPNVTAYALIDNYKHVKYFFNFMDVSRLLTKVLRLVSLNCLARILLTSC